MTETHYEEFVTTDGCKGRNNEVNYLEHVQVKITLNYHRRGNAVIHNMKNFSYMNTTS
jgi:hypothetical protein